MAPQKTLEGSRISGKGNSNSKVPSPASSMVDQGNKCLTRPTSAPSASCHSNLYRRLKRRLGCSLRRLHSKRHVVSSRKSSSYKLPGTKSCLAGLEKIPAPSTRKCGSSCHRQLYSCGIHQQGGRYEVRLTLCPSMATPVLVQPETDCSKGQTYPGSPECDCRQVVPARPNHSERMVSASIQQPFNKARHRYLTNLNLHAWLLEPRQSRSKDSLVQWRHELRLLKEVQPEQSMRQNGPFLSDGVKKVRWTSGLHLSNK